MVFSFQNSVAIFILVIAASFGLIFFVNRQSTDKKANLVFNFLNLSLLLWFVPVFFVTVFARNLNSFLPRLSMIGSVGINIGTFLLSVHLVKKFYKDSKWLTIFMITVAIILVPLVLSPYVFLETTAGVTAGITAKIGWGMYLFAFFTFLSLVSSIFILFCGISRASDRVEKKKLQWMLVGFSGMSAGFVFTIMIPIILTGNAEMVKFGGFYILFFFICTAIAIVKYQLFNIRIIATEFLVLILNSILFVQLVASNSIKRGLFNGLLLILCGVLSYLLVKSARHELKQEQDITRAEALEESNKRLQELDKQKTEFLNIAAHQLRTPVSIIKNYVSMLEDGDYGQVGEEMKKVHQNIGESNEWLVRLADEFLNIANLEQGRVKFRFEDVDLGNLIESVTKELKVRAESKGLEVVWQRPEQSLHAKIDEEKMRNVIFNFIDNAIKYAEQGNITVLAANEDNGVAVRVVDHGMGFDKKDESKLFQKFQRGENAKEYEVNTSTGLGLYIARMFVEGHGGKVWAKSGGVGNGSEFGFWLPLERN